MLICMIVLFMVSFIWLDQQQRTLKITDVCLGHLDKTTGVESSHCTQASNKISKQNGHSEPSKSNSTKQESAHGQEQDNQIRKKYSGYESDGDVDVENDYATSNSSNALKTFPTLPDYPLFLKAHTSQEAAKLAGKWIKKPEHAIKYSKEHLACLDAERQGNCHDPESWMNTTDNARFHRYESIKANAILNSAGILNASDPWVWESGHTAYKVIPYESADFYKKRIRKLFANGRKIYLIGDSLTRQWTQVLRCEMEFLLGFDKERAKSHILFFPDHTFRETVKNLKYLQDASPNDYVVMNFGHHFGPAKLGPDWNVTYMGILNQIQDFKFGDIPDHHVFFRTTSVRHFLEGQGDWNTEKSKAGGTEPNMAARWDMYGGNTQEQPYQNLMVLDVLASARRKRNFQILDTSPMMLARGDASFDGNHFCLPGPHQFWSQMLYYKFEQENNSTVKAT
ncbi:hypothetical protein ACA910_002454 [Epithemia clementina (nom. ined.)]